jgi:nucleoside-diphosphate-sugar epimerase
MHYYHVQYGVAHAALRYANVYGPRQDPHGEAGVVAIFCNNLAAGKTSTINGSGEQTRDYVYVGDVAHANVLALEKEAPSGAYNIGTDIETSVNRLINESGHSVETFRGFVGDASQVGPADGDACLLHCTNDLHPYAIP